MVTEMVTLFIYMFDEDFLYATLFYTQLFFIRNSFLYATLFYTHLEELYL